MAKSDAKFWNKIAAKYAASPVSDEAAYQAKLEKTRALFTPHTRMLEIGCGTGTTALLHAPHVATIRATDFSDEMLKIARQKADVGQIGNVTFETAPADDIDGPYDVIMAMSLLHLLPNRTEIIAKVFDGLKPGGFFVSSTVCLMERLWFLRPILPIARLFGQAPWVAFLRAEELRRDMRDAGFEIVEDWQPNAKSALFLIAKKPD